MTSESNLKNNNKSVMIIGGGVAGMAAAKKLSENEINVHIIEKNNYLGGHSHEWACMATNTCQQCSACLGYEMADKISIPSNINTYLNSEVVKIDKNKQKYTARLNNDNNSIIEADSIIMATGFTPSQPQGLLNDQYKSNKNVITTEELNTIIKNHSFHKYFPKTNSPNIGFIQCVGSRNREIGRDYCSQVCCKVSLRHINKLLHIFPDAKISLFYIDLQIIGKETRSKFDALSNNVDLIQGVPYEIFNDKMDGKLSVIREDSIDGRRIADHFDMMVLSLGIKSSDTTAGLTGMLDIPVDQWGFVNDHDALAKKNIYAAGCASGPGDILTAKHQGIICAENIIQSFRSEQENHEKADTSIAIIGDGNQAWKTALAISDKGYNVWMFGTDNNNKIIAPNIYHLPDTNLISVKGTQGAFSILYNDDKNIKYEKVAAIIVAEPARTMSLQKTTNFPSELLYSLEGLSDIALNDIETIPQSIVFWLDYSDHEFKTFSRKALLIALELSETGRSITFIMNQMLVHGIEGQQIYDKARKQGIKFLRIDSSEDVNVEKKNTKLSFDVKEKTLKNLIISFECDWLIIPENIFPSYKNQLIAKLLKADMDNEGYLQAANVRHRLINSPRRGIFFTGSCHDETDEDDQNLEIELLLSSIASITEENINVYHSDFKIDIDKCGQCLTCLRTCPHGAIILNKNMKPYIDSKACFSCGLCLSSCPALAIESKEFCDESYVNPASKAEVVIFACERSGALTAPQIEHDLMVNIQKVPCVCRISENILLKALENGAKRILLAGCHHDNCNSIKGSQKALTRTNLLNKIPGIDDSTFTWYPIAANESERFKEFLTQEFLC